MKKFNVSKFLAVTLSFALAISATPVPTHAAPAAAMPDFVKALTPSEQLGFVDSFYKGSTDHPVVLIQDLHSNYGVQQKIRSLLEFLQPKVAPTGRSMVVGVEGAWGDVSMEPIKKEPADIRKAVSDYLLKESEMTGMEYFAAMSDSKVRIVGIDDPQNYTIHTELFRKSLSARLSLAQKTDKLRLVINDSKLTSPSGLRRLWKIEEALHQGEMDLTTFSKKMGVNVSNYKEAEQALAAAKSEFLSKQKGEKGVFLSNLVEADKNLSLLGRLLRQQLTLDEVKMAAKQIPSMLTTIRVMLPQDNPLLWADTVKSAMDHYAVALVRDTPMAKNALELARSNADTSVVVVTGGFHTAGITDILKQKGVSYVVIAPVVESHTAKDEAVYAKRMLDIHVSVQDMQKGLSVRPAAQSVSAQTPLQAASTPGTTFANGPVALTQAIATAEGSVAAAPVVEAAIAQAQAVDGVTAASPALPSGFFAAIGARLRQIGVAFKIVKPREVDMPVSEQENALAADTASTPAAAEKGAASTRTAKLAKIGTIALAGVLVSASAFAQQPGVQETVHSGSSTLGAALGVLAVVGGAVGAGVAVARARARKAAGNIGKDKNQQILEEQINERRDGLYGLSA